MVKTVLKKQILLGGIFGVLAVTFIVVAKAQAYDYGWSPCTTCVPIEPVLAPQCGSEKPAPPVLYEPWHPLLPTAQNPGEVRLNWHKAARATHYTIAYGLSPGNYIYGVPNTGDTDHYTIGSLAPGVNYYFAVRGVNDCMPGPFSNEWAARSRGRGSGVLGAFTPSLDSVPAPRFPRVQGSSSMATPTPQPQVKGVSTRGVQPTPRPTMRPVPTPTPQPESGGIANFLRRLLGGR